MRRGRNGSFSLGVFFFCFRFFCVVDDGIAGENKVYGNSRGFSRMTHVPEKGRLQLDDSFFYYFTFWEQLKRM